MTKNINEITECHAGSTGGLKKWGYQLPAKLLRSSYAVSPLVLLVLEADKIIVPVRGNLSCVFIFEQFEVR